MAVRLLLFGLMGPFAAAFINRYGVRKVTLTALGLIASGLALSLAINRLWQLIALWGVIVGLGTGCRCWRPLRRIPAGAWRC